MTISEPQRSGLPAGALATVAALQIQDQMSQWHNADAYVVRLHDPEAGDGDATIIGPFSSEAEAFAHRAQQEVALNRGLGDGDAPFEVDVLPLFNPGRLGEPTTTPTKRTSMANLPTFEDMRGRAHALLGDAQDELRSDWQAGSGPSTEQGRAAREARELIAKAKAALDRAAP